MLSITHITKSYGFHQILNGASFTLQTGECLGLVGANGVGKSTILKIIMGQIEADSGLVHIPDDWRVGYLEQSLQVAVDATLADMITQSMQLLHDLEIRMRDLEAQMTHLQGPALERAMQDYGDVSDRFERYGGYEIDYQVDTVLNGLGVGHIPRDRLFMTLSGGEKSRVGLALLLLSAPDVLLLDEPTNHLDFQSLAWLEGYLQSYRGAILIVSHDRQFLNRTVHAIIEIDEHSRVCKRYAGNYDAYHQAKLLERRRWHEDYKNQQEEIKELRLAIKVTARRNSNYRPKYAFSGDKFLKNSKSEQHEATVSKRVRSAEEKLKRIEDNPIPEPPDDLLFNPDFDPQSLRGRMPLRVSGLRKAFGQQCILGQCQL